MLSDFPETSFERKQPEMCSLDGLGRFLSSDKKKKKRGRRSEVGDVTVPHKGILGLALGSVLLWLLLRPSGTVLSIS